MPPRREIRTPAQRGESSNAGGVTPEEREEERQRLQLEANRLKQETLNVLLQERQATQNNQAMTGKSAFEKIDHSRPPKYNGTVDPRVMNEWVDQFESLFAVHQTPEDKKVDIATFYLHEEAGKWWKQVKVACSWEELKKMLSE